MNSTDTSLEEAAQDWFVTNQNLANAIQIGSHKSVLKQCTCMHMSGLTWMCDFCDFCNFCDDKTSLLKLSNM